MQMRIVPRVKPLYLMHQEGVSEEHLSAVLAGIREILQLAGATHLIPIHNFGVWRLRDYLDGRTLKPYQSIDWYLGHARQMGRRNQLNADTMMVDLYEEPWQNQTAHYDVVVVNDDLWSGESDNNFVIGSAIRGIGTVVSVARFEGLPEECIETEVLHEMGHVFGLVPDERTTNVEESLGRHCTNRCSMRQGLRVPDDWIQFTDDRLQVGAFCRQCQRDIKQFFADC